MQRTLHNKPEPTPESVISGVMSNNNAGHSMNDDDNRYNRTQIQGSQEADMQKATAKEIDTLVEANSVREMRAVVTPTGGYALVVETVGGKELMMYSKTGNVRTFIDVDRLIGWCQKRGFYRIEVYSKAPEEAEAV